MTFDRKQLNHFKTTTRHNMWRITLWMFVAVVGLGFVSCSITCPDGTVCSDSSTCCETFVGYGCCEYPDAVCCDDLAHCCPSGFRCNTTLETCEIQGQPWMTVPMLKKVAAELPSKPVQPASPLQETDNNFVHHQAAEQSSSVRCDSQHSCPGGTTCCRHPKGVWFCCPYWPGTCCLDGYHCCPYHLDCDVTYTNCVGKGLRYPFSPRKAAASVPATFIPTVEKKVKLQEKPMTALTETIIRASKTAVTRCDVKTYCPGGKSCCKTPSGRWGCCPHSLGQCCADGLHCCEYGYTCDPTSMKCRGWYSEIPSGPQEDAIQEFL